MRIPQKELHHQLRAEAIATRDRIAGMVRGLDASKLALATRLSSPAVMGSEDEPR